MYELKKKLKEIVFIQYPLKKSNLTTAINNYIKFMQYIKEK